MVAHYRVVVRLQRDGVETAAHLAAGLGIVGVAGYVYVAIVGRAFGEPEQASTVSALLSIYLLINIIGPGLFTALEQATSRAVSEATTLGRSVRPAAIRAALLGSGTCLGLVTAILVAWPVLLGPVLDRRIGLLAALMVAIVGSAAVYWVRGVLSGQQRFGPYAATFYVEGGVRLIPLVALFAVGAAQPDVYALVFAVGSFLAAIAVFPSMKLPKHRSADVGPSGLGRSYALLAGATAMSQTIANLAPVVVTYRLSGDTVAASVFGATFVLARVPLFLFSPVLAVILPRMTRDVVDDRLDLVAGLLRRVVWSLLCVGSVGIVVGAILGPWAVEVLFNSLLRPTAFTLASLGAATVMMMLALVLQPTLVALGRQSVVTRGWIFGTVTFLGVLVVPMDPISAALLAQFAGPFVVVVYLGWHVWRPLSSSRAGSTRPQASEPHG